MLQPRAVALAPPLPAQGREQDDHSNGMPSVSGKPKARLRFCIACVAAPLSRLSSVATTTRRRPSRSEEHTSELQSLMRISYAVFCLKKKTQTTNTIRRSDKRKQ